MNETAEIGIFGGTGIYDSGLLKDSKEISMDTPYGKTSDSITIGEFNERKVAFMPRHGKKHTIPPHLINFRANIWAFKELGVKRIIAPSALGSLKEEFEPGHRHMSHLYGFHPGDQITFSQTPKLFNSVKKTLEYRLKNGGAGTGWSRAWLINCAARLMDSQMTQNNIELLLQKSIYPNLFDAHPPFQIDGNFGYTAGVVESLIQSHELNMIRILPALPNNWKKGKIIGFKARDNIIVDMTWSDNTLNKLTLTSKFDIRKNIIYNKKQVTVDLRKGIPTEIKF